jgi:hypothetical protein
VNADSFQRKQERDDVIPTRLNDYNSLEFWFGEDAGLEMSKESQIEREMWRRSARGMESSVKSFGMKGEKWREEFLNGRTALKY